MTKRAIRTAAEEALPESEKTYGQKHIISTCKKAVNGGIMTRINQKIEAVRLDSILAGATSEEICFYPNYNRISISPTS